MKLKEAKNMKSISKEELEAYKKAEWKSQADADFDEQDLIERQIDAAIEEEHSIKGSD